MSLPCSALGGCLTQMQLTQMQMPIGERDEDEQDTACLGNYVMFAATLQLSGCCCWLSEESRGWVCPVVDVQSRRYVKIRVLCMRNIVAAVF